MAVILAENRSASYDYDILDTWEAGISLIGAEVKSVRQKGTRLGGSYVKILNHEAWLVGTHIANYKNSAEKFDPTRSRRLLLTHAEINKLAGLTSQKGYVLIPLKLYASGSRIKLTIGYGKARKRYDKKQLEKARDLSREEARELAS